MATGDSHPSPGTLGLAGVGWAHPRPQDPGKGCSSLNSFNASRYFPLLVNATNPWMLTWAGQVALHGAVDRLEMP